MQGKQFGSTKGFATFSQEEPKNSHYLGISTKELSSFSTKSKTNLMLANQSRKVFVINSQPQEESVDSDK